jgi:hypothetical protein
MFSIFTTKPQEPTHPVLTPLMPRESFSSECNEQEHSPFFATLPPEIRNEIYAYAFSSNARAELSLEPHPLSLLRTCQKSYYEASVLAFRHSIFPLAASLDLSTYISMQNATKHLSSSQTHAITALSHSLRKNYTEFDRNSGIASIIANAVMLFPNLKRFEICIPRGKKRRDEMHYNYVNSGSPAYFDVHAHSVESYAPYWFNVSFLQYLIKGHAYAWQAGEPWSTEWPQLVDDKYFGDLDDRYPHLTPPMSPDAVGNVRGVHMCPCQCGNVEWTSIDIVQRTGRKVAIDTVYYGAEYSEVPELVQEQLLKVRRGCKAVILKEGSPPLDVVDGLSYAYDADDSYWEKMRLKNGNWGAIWRGVWRNLTSQTIEESFPGSLSLSEGDWACPKDASGGGESSKADVFACVAEDSI